MMPAYQTHASAKGLCVAYQTAKGNDDDVH